MGVFLFRGKSDTENRIISDGNRIRTGSLHVNCLWF